MIVATSTSAKELIPMNRLRKSVTIMNVDSTDTVYIKRERNNLLTVTSGNFDIRLSPGAALSINSLLDGTEAIQDRYTIIASANTPNVSVFETEDIIR